MFTLPITCADRPTVSYRKSLSARDISTAGGRYHGRGYLQAEDGSDSTDGGACEVIKLVLARNSITCTATTVS